MDLEGLKDYRKVTEAENIHNEIFHTTTEYQYYLLGIAQSMATLYKTLAEFKGKYTYTEEDLMKLIIDGASTDEQINKYFNRLVSRKND